MFQFSRLPSGAYVFSAERCRITSIGFPHSEIRGSKTVQRLPAAYRSRPRPSSAPGAKASAMCPSYLDGEPPALTRGRAIYFGLCAVFKLRRGRLRRTSASGPSKLSSVNASRLAKRGQLERKSGRHSRNVSLERR
jgi:hypothetical protein